MSFIKKTWKKGDIITSEALNNIENGIQESIVNLSPLPVEANITSDDQTGKESIALSINAYALYTAMDSGRKIKYHSFAQVDGNEVDVTNICQLDAQKLEISSGTLYGFSVVIVDDEKGIKGYYGLFSSDDTVVLTEV